MAALADRGGRCIDLLADSTSLYHAGMPKAQRRSQSPGISDASVKKATGHAWAHWHKVLSKFDVGKNGHAAAAEFLYEKHGVPGWWCQMVVVGHERARGLRQKNQQGGLFVAHVSKTFEASALEVIDAWAKPAKKRKWLGDEVTVHKVSPPKSVRATWNGDPKIQEPGTKSISIWLTEKKGKDGVVKCQMGLQHEKLASATKMAAVKRWWTRRVELLVQPSP